jgi:hypothetical protein
MKCTHDFNAEHRDGRYFRFGVREFGMAAIVNGLFGTQRCSPRVLTLAGLSCHACHYTSGRTMPALVSHARCGFGLLVIGVAATRPTRPPCLHAQRTAG